jgi:hypothetical protein
VLDVADLLSQETVVILSAVRPARSDILITIISNAKNAVMPPVKSETIHFRVVPLIVQT